MRSDQIRPLLKSAAAKISWHPKYTAKRMQNWLDSMEDWMISRKRFYGLPLPFYPCSCGQLTVVGDLEELRQLAVDPKLVDNLPSIHRPWIDQIQIHCPKCQKNISRISDVGDVWLDAGIVPFSTLNYLEDKKFWRSWFPADLVLEMTEQVRLWFYSMLFMSVTLENTPPYKEVVTHAEVRDEKGERMSKTKKNGIPYNQAVDKMSADAMRWLYCQQTSHTAVNFGYHIADQLKKDFILILWNSYRFFTQHANLNDFSPSKINQPLSPIDRWLLSRLHSTIGKVTHYLNKFQTPPATKAISELIADLSTWYIRRNRQRTDNLDLLFQSFETISQLLSPFTPFISEIIYQNLHPKTSVHLQKWPKVNKELINKQLENDMLTVRNLCQQIHALRQSAQIKLRQPLQSATINVKLNSKLTNIIREEANLKKIIFGSKISLDTNITPKLLAEGEYRDLVRSIQLARKQQNLSLNDKVKIFCPNWPKTFEKQILEKTQAISIEKADKLEIKKTQ